LVNLMMIKLNELKPQWIKRAKIWALKRDDFLSWDAAMICHD
jgi:hypothetical protein